MRKEAETTKLHVVYDASAKSRKGDRSLNECLHTGPPVTPLLFDILLRLRTYPIVLIADMKKAFLQTEVDEGDPDCLRLLWAKNPLAEDMEIEEFWFTRMIFGAGPSPFLLNGTVRRYHLMQYNVQDPEFVKCVIDSLYVDDFAGGGQKTDEVYDLYKKILEKMAEGGFTMHKWKTNNPELRRKVEETSSPLEDSMTYAHQSLGTTKDVKILGLKWDQDKDTLAVKLMTSKAEEAMQEVAKSKVLSSTSAIFDPLGIVSPVTAVGKILLQEICKKNTSWDEPITGEIERTWKQWQRELKKVEEIVFSRSLLQTIGEPVERKWLHGFGDARKQAYCAVIYLVQQQFSGTYA